MPDAKKDPLRIAIYIHVDEEEGEVFVEQVNPYNNQFKMVVDDADQSDHEIERQSLIQGIVEGLNLVIRSSNKDWELLAEAKDLLLKKWSDPKPTYHKDQLG